MLEWLKTSTGSYNLAFILTLIAWLTGGIGIIAGFHHNKVSNMEAGENAKEAQQDQKKTEEELESSRLEVKKLEAQVIPLKTAIPARRITADQRDLFLETLASEDNKSPKISIRIIVTSDDPETKNFAKQFRALLNEAGHSVKKGEGVITIPPPPNRFLDDKHNRMPNLVALYNNGCGYSELSRTGFGSVMIMNASPAQIAKGDKSHPRVYRYTENPNDILLGIQQTLSFIGINTHSIYADAILEPGEVAFYVPSQIE